MSVTAGRLVFLHNNGDFSFIEKRFNTSMEVNETKKVVLALNYSEGHFNQFSLLSDEG